MNKFKTIVLAILGGINVVVDIAIPILIAILWVRLNGMANWSTYFFYALGLIASFYRAIKIGWFKHE